MRHKDVKQYSSESKWFHWLIASIVILMLSFSFFLDDLPKDIQPTAYMLHKSFGLTVLFLMLLRIFFLHLKGRPPLPSSTPIWEKWLSRLVQYGFYVLLICMPLCGWIMSVADGRVPTYFGLFKVPFPVHQSKALGEFMLQAHVTIAWVLIGLLFLHVAGALKHHFFDKDKVLTRMLPRR